MFPRGTMGDPWETYAFDDLHCGHGLHQDTVLGNSDAIAHATLTALWLFLLPIFKHNLNRNKKAEDGQEKKQRCTSSSSRSSTSDTTNQSRPFSAGFTGDVTRYASQKMHFMTTWCRLFISVRRI
jgi:hypothetical protein